MSMTEIQKYFISLEIFCNFKTSICINCRAIFYYFTMKISTLLSHSAKLFSLMLRSPQPSDVLASQYFRKRKYIGSNDRKFISESVFATMRMKLLSEICSSTFPVSNTNLHDKIVIASTITIIHNVDYYSEIFKPAHILSKMLKDDDLDLNEIIFAALIELDILNPDSAKHFAKTIIERLSSLDSRARDVLMNSSNPSAEQLKLLENRYSLPLWISKDWIDSPLHIRSWANACQLADSMLFPASLCLRVNTNLTSVKYVMDLLKSKGIECHKGKLSPFSIIINQRIDLRNDILFKEGIIEVQDEGSQMIGICLSPEPKEKILDSCAGAGGKSLQICSMQNDSGEIIATDIELKKLKELNKRADRSGFKSIKTFLANKKLSDNIEHESFDKVLVDAPCSGSGTFRRSPILKWRISRSSVKKNAKKQFKLLNEYSRYLKPGGILVYATCSILPEENDIVVDRFLRENKNFRKDAIKPAFDRFDVKIQDLNDNSHSLSLTPHDHNTDGFFMVRLRKV